MVSRFNDFNLIKELIMTTEYPTLLQINASLFAGQGQSSQLSNAFVQRWQQENPHGQVVVRDLGSDPLPHFDGEYLSALATPAEQRSATQAARVALADQLIAELKAAQVLVLGVPMYNFGVPSQLKAWIDYVARAGATFRYGANGPEGLAGDRPTLIFATRGGQYRDTSADSQTPYLRTFLNFIGIHDIEFVYAEGLARQDRQQASLQQAHQQAAEWLASERATQPLAA